MFVADDAFRIDVLVICFIKNGNKQAEFSACLKKSDALKKERV